MGLKRPLTHGFLRDITLLSRPAGCVGEKRTSIASGPYSVNEGPESVITAAGIDRAISDGESEKAFQELRGHRRENFDLAGVVRASAHGMRLSAIEYGKCA